MQKRYTLIICLLFLVSLQQVSAQIVDVCGTDTIVLKMSNYQYGTIHWEKAKTIGKWNAVPNAHDFEYKFLPEEDMYYRAVVKFPDCPPVYSAISFVQMPPVANAGIDRIVSANQINLSANDEISGYGRWSILSGEEGEIEQVANPYSVFHLSDSLYTLEWRRVNACGQSRDTIQIRHRELVFRDNLVVVDTTDIILSSNQELANGIYIIQFNEPVPTITESSVLIGMGNGGFLRTIDSFTSDANTFTLQTSQATFEDLIDEGVLNVAQVLDFETFSEKEKESGPFRQLQRMPTRAELMTQEKFSTGQNFYYKISEETTFMHPETELKFRKSDKGATEISINLPYPNLIDFGNVSAGISGSYTFQPNLVADFDYSYLFGTNHIKFGSSNAIEEKSIGLYVNVESDVSTPERKFNVLSVTRNYLVLLGSVPVIISVNLSVDGEFQAGASAEIHYFLGIKEKNTINAYLEYKDNSWGYVYNKTGTSSVENDLSVNGSLEQKFSIGPSLSFTVYKFLGPYIDFSVDQKMSLCANQDLDWKAEVDLSSSLTLGAKATVLGHDLVEISRSWPRPFLNYTFPYKIDIFSGNNQTYIPGEALEFNPRVKLGSNVGVGLPVGKIMFAPKNGGVVSDSIVFADSGGFADVMWFPGDSIMSKLDVFVFDCEGNHIKNSPLTLIAYADTTDICAGSSLFASVVERDSIISPVAHLGIPPYQYSTDGEIFTDSVPEIIYQYETLYNFTVMDADECVAEISYLIPDPCTNSDLAMNILVLDNIISIEPVNGQPPYMYSIDGNSFIFESPEIVSESGNSYTLFVRDDLGCVASGIYTEPDLCEELGLAIELQVHSDTVSMVAFGGTPPYAYSIDGENFIESIPAVLVESSTPITFFVTDAINCSVSAHFDPCVEYGFTIYPELTGDTLTVVAEGGFTPYYYSVNGGYYTEEAPQIVPEHAMDYVFHVMDSIQCTLEIAYNVCDESDLSLSVVILDEEIIAQVEGGNPPYLYAINDTLSFSEHNSFFAGSGYHTIFVKDDLGCIVSEEVYKIECSEDGILIGNQCWMAENLNHEVGNSWCYNDNPVNCDVYGRLYDWQTAMTACPQGWRLPNDEDWNALTSYLKQNGFNTEWEDEASQFITNRTAKSLASQNYWAYSGCSIQGFDTEEPTNCPCPGQELYLNNTSGFNGLPGGFYRSDLESYSSKGEVARWWSSTTNKADFSLINHLCQPHPGYALTEGWRFYVRCVQE